MNAIAKRKTVTSSEVKNRWNAKTYKRYTLSLRKEEDAELIEYIDEQAEQGRRITEIFRDAMENVNIKG